MLEDVFEILNASPQLERLSLGPISTADNPQPPSERVAQLPNVTSLSLENYAHVVGYILAYVDAPALSPLDIIAYILNNQENQAVDDIFPHGHTSTRLFSDPPVFKIGWPGINFKCDVICLTLTLHIGNFKIKLVSPKSFETRTTPWFSLVPSSLTNLQVDSKLMLNQEEWREFFQTHREVRSIECGRSPFEGRPVARSRG